MNGKQAKRLRGKAALTAQYIVAKRTPVLLRHLLTSVTVEHVTLRLDPHCSRAVYQQRKRQFRLRAA